MRRWLNWLFGHKCEWRFTIKDGETVRWCERCGKCETFKGDAWRE